MNVTGNVYVNVNVNGYENLHRSFSLLTSAF